jgi:hypothetical protein
VGTLASRVSKRAPMLTKNRLDPADPLPRFLAEQAEDGDIRDEGVVLARLFKASLLVAAVAVTGIAVIAFGNPVALFTNTTASLAGSSSPQPDSDPSAPPLRAADEPALKQALADAQVPPPNAIDTPAPAELSAAEPTATMQAQQEKAPADTGGPSSEALFRQFQAWVADQDAHAKPEPAQPALAAPAPIMQEAPAAAADDDRVAHPPAQKRRPVAAAHTAPPVDLHAQPARKPAPRTQAQEAPHAPRPPARVVQDARAQQEPPPPQPQPAQQSSSFLPFFNGRN